MSTQTDHSDRAIDYARNVVSGEILACKNVKLACQRFLDDLKRSKTKAFPYKYDPEKASRPCRFLEKFKHLKGPKANRGERIRLEDWQCFLICNVYGWLHKGTKTKRRFKRAVVLVPRKNGKTLIAAGLALYGLAAEKELGAEVFCAANSLKQARECWDAAKLLAERSPQFREAFGVEVLANAIVVQGTASKLIPLTSKPRDGSNPSAPTILDEYHEASSTKLYDSLAMGMGARESPLLFVISTAGHELGPCYHLVSECQKILEGSLADDSTFALLYGIDEGDDWTTDEAIFKANPCVGVSQEVADIQQERDRALNNPAAANTYKTKRLNVWVNGRSAYFNAIKWIGLGDSNLSIDDFKGERCWLGLDLSSKLDLTARVALFERDGNLYAFPQFWLPEKQAEVIKSQPYRLLAQAGHIKLTPGDVVDYEFVEKDLATLKANHKLVEVAFDNWNATQLGTRMQAMGLPMVDHNCKSVKAMSDPTKQLQALIISGGIKHNANPIMAWNIANVQCKLDTNDNVKPVKDRPDQKIDGAVALVMALARQMATAPDKPRDNRILF